MPVVAEVVLRRRGVAVHRLEVRHHELRHVRPVARSAASRPRGSPASVSCFFSADGARHVAVDRVVERRHVGRALDRRVAAQRHDAAARPADVAEQQLEQRAAADDLRRRWCAASTPPRRRTTWSGPAPELARMRLGDLAGTCPAGSRSTARPSPACSGEVPLDDLEDAARVLQRLVALRRRLQQRPDQRVVRRARRGAAAPCWLPAAPTACPASRRTAPSPPTRALIADARAARTASSGRRTGRRSRCTATPARRAVLHQPGEHAVDVLGVLELRRR